MQSTSVTCDSDVLYGIVQPSKHAFLPVMICYYSFILVFDPLQGLASMSTDTNEVPNLSGYWLYFYSICVVTPPQASRGFLLCAPAGRFQHIYSLNNKNDVKLIIWPIATLLSLRLAQHSKRTLMGPQAYNVPFNGWFEHGHLSVTKPSSV